MKAFMPLWSFRKKQGSKKFRGLVTRNIFFVYRELRSTSKIG